MDSVAVSVGVCTVALARQWAVMWAIWLLGTVLFLVVDLLIPGEFCRKTLEFCRAIMARCVGYSGVRGETPQE